MSLYFPSELSLGAFIRDNDEGFNLSQKFSCWTLILFIERRGARTQQVALHKQHLMLRNQTLFIVHKISDFLSEVY